MEGVNEMPTKPEPPSSSTHAVLREELQNLSGHDPVLRTMLRRGGRLDRARYLALSGMTEDDVGPERELDIPRPFQRQPTEA